MGDIADVVRIDTYPFREASENKSYVFHRGYQKRMKILETDTLTGDNCKAVYPISQGFAGGTRKWAVPTYDELALMYWAGVVYKGKGAYEIYIYGRDFKLQR